MYSIFFRAIAVSFPHLCWMHRLKGQCVHSGHFSMHRSWRGRDALNSCPGNIWMEGICRHNPNAVTVANPHLSVGTVPETNSETTDLKTDHVILLPSLYIHGLAFHRSIDPKLLSNQTPAFSCGIKYFETQTVQDMG